MSRTSIKVKSNAQEVLEKLDKNCGKALTAAGIQAERLILGQMQSGFGRPIWRTGDLQRDVNFEVHTESKSVDVGNSLSYAPFVHDGTSRMAARPYITRALTGSNARDALEQAIGDALRDGF